MTDDQAGFAARYPTICGRCPNDINVGDRVVRQGGRLVHVGCASGSDDE